jgi:protein involved in polysaccharide export with SLBB domain
MKKIRQYYFPIIFLCAVLFQNRIFGQIVPPQPPSETNYKNSSIENGVASEEQLIHFGDLIDVDVIGSTEYDWRGTLNAEGFLNGVNFTQNPIYGLCQAESDVAAKIAAEYGRILRAPTVAVKILDRSNRAVAVLYGAVKKNQRFQIKRPVRLSEIIVRAGGFTERASGAIQILRAPKLNCQREAAKQTVAKAVPAAAVSGAPPIEKATKSESQETEYINIEIGDLLAGKKEANPQILSGDVVTVLESKPIYVIGAVGAPKLISIRAQIITLSRAVASAGGLAKNADATKITIFRRAAVGGEAKTIDADLVKVKAGATEDIVLQAFDIVEVAQKGNTKRKLSPLLNAGDQIRERAARNLPLQIIN